MKSIVLWITVLLLVGAPEPIRDGPGDVSDQPIPQTFPDHLRQTGPIGIARVGGEFVPSFGDPIGPEGELVGGVSPGFGTVCCHGDFPRWASPGQRIAKCDTAVGECAGGITKKPPGIPEGIERSSKWDSGWGARAQSSGVSAPVR